MRVKPIIFDTFDVRAILGGRKTTKRFICKVPRGTYSVDYNIEDDTYEAIYGFGGFGFCMDMFKTLKAPYNENDILYVKERFCYGTIECGEEYDGREAYYVDDSDDPSDSFIPYQYCIKNDIGIDGVRWKSPAQMPKEIARIWLKVKDVRVERLQDITEEEAKKEGFTGERCYCVETGSTSRCTCCMGTGWIEPPRYEFVCEWDSTLKKKAKELYGWNANPFVWVIEFEICEKPEVSK